MDKSNFLTILNNIMNLNNIISKKEFEKMGNYMESIGEPVEEKITKLKKEIENDTLLLGAMNSFLQNPDEKLYDIDGIDGLNKEITILMMTSNFKYEDWSKPLIEKIKVVEARIKNIIELKKLLLRMEEFDLERN